AHVQRVRVGDAVDRDGADAELAAGADHAERDLAAVGDEDLADAGSGAGHPDLRTLKSASPYSTGLPFCASTSTIVPAISDSISFMSIIASTMQSTWPGRISVPTSTKGAASGEGAR